MDDIANGRNTREEVVGHSRQLLANVMEQLLPKAVELGESLKDATAADAKVGVCPKSGHDLLVKSSPKTRGQFVGCSGWPECDVTYPLPQGKIEAVPTPCPECGTPQVRVIQFRSKPFERCLDPNCTTNAEPTVDIGACPTCAADSRPGGRLIAQRSPRTLKRFARCVNYEQCDTSYPLPGRGEIVATDETCEPCGSPVVVITTARGPWRICVDPNCTSKTEPKKKPAPKKKATPKAGAKKPAARSRKKS